MDLLNQLSRRGDSAFRASGLAYLLELKESERIDEAFATGLFVDFDFASGSITKAFEWLGRTTRENRSTSSKENSFE